MVPENTCSAISGYAILLRADGRSGLMADSSHPADDSIPASDIRAELARILA